jgi:mRNA interferase MazF
MTINFHPKAGMVLRCDLGGSVTPEISKIRPVVVITPWYVRRAGLATIVPLSTQRPRRLCRYHIRLSAPAFPDAAVEVWAKCDLAMSVSYARLDRIQLRSGKFVTGFVSDSDLQRIYSAVAYGFGVDLNDARD